MTTTPTPADPYKEVFGFDGQPPSPARSDMLEAERWPHGATEEACSSCGLTVGESRLLYDLKRGEVKIVSTESAPSGETIDLEAERALFEASEIAQQQACHPQEPLTEKEKAYVLRREPQQRDTYAACGGQWEGWKRRAALARRATAALSSDEQDQRAFELASAALIAAQPRDITPNGWKRHEHAINAVSCALHKPARRATAGTTAPNSPEFDGISAGTTAAQPCPECKGRGYTDSGDPETGATMYDYICEGCVGSGVAGTTAAPSDELLLCPCCGTEATMVAPPGVGSWRVACLQSKGGCGLAGRLTFDGGATATREWNQRATAGNAAPTELRKSAQALVAAFNDPACSLASVQNYVSDLETALATPAATAAPGDLQTLPELSSLTRYEELDNDVGGVAPHAQGRFVKLRAVEKLLAALSPVLASNAGAAPADPMDWPLPCDVTVGAGTIKKGCKLRTLVSRMESLHRMAVEGLPKVTQEQRDAFFKQFPHLAPSNNSPAGAQGQDK